MKKMLLPLLLGVIVLASCGHDAAPATTGTVDTVAAKPAKPLPADTTAKPVVVKKVKHHATVVDSSKLQNMHVYGGVPDKAHRYGDTDPYVVAKTSSDTTHQ